MYMHKSCRPEILTVIPTFTFRCILRTLLLAVEHAHGSVSACRLIAIPLQLGSLMLICSAEALLRAGSARHVFVVEDEQSIRQLLKASWADGMV